ncbi:MAG: insulinase family protein, partial [Odoribacter sp.]|nr:insulinase family protein [Odoribacter sp.]
RIAYNEINYQNKSTNLAFFEFLGDLQLINTEVNYYSQINADSIKQTARKIFRKENSSTLYYLKK